MRLLMRMSALWLLVVTTNAWAATVVSSAIGMRYNQFTSCYFNHHQFTVELVGVIKDLVKQGKGVVFDEPVVVGFSGRKPSNKGFYVDYDQENCIPNFQAMQTTCSIKLKDFKYGTVPQVYQRAYLDEVRAGLIQRGQDAALLSQFVDGLTRAIRDDNSVTRKGVEIAGLGIFSVDIKSSDNIFYNALDLADFDKPISTPTSYGTCPVPVSIRITSVDGKYQVPSGWSEVVYVNGSLYFYNGSSGGVWQNGVRVGGTPFVIATLKIYYCEAKSPYTDFCDYNGSFMYGVYRQSPEKIIYSNVTSVGVPLSISYDGITVHFVIDKYSGADLTQRINAPFEYLP